MKKAMLGFCATLLAVALFAGCGGGGSDAKELVRGTKSGSTYTNDTASLEFTLPSGWAFSTDEEIAAVLNIGAEALADAGENISFEALQLTTIYDMMASDPATGASTQVLLENNKMSVDQYFTVLQQQLKSVGAYTFGDTYDVTIGGEKYTAIRADVNSGVVTQYYYLRKMGDYYVGIINTCYSAESADPILDNYS